MLDPKTLYRLGYRVLKPVSRAFRARVLRRARDYSEALTRGHALVLAPHPDDETLGCGATILRKREGGYAVHVLVATDGARSHDDGVIAHDALVSLRREEMLEAARRLGLHERDVTFLGHPDGELWLARGAVEGEIATAIREHQPDQVFVTSRLDAHADHQLLAEAAHAAVIATGYEGALFEYPIWYWERLPWIHRPRNPVAALWYLLSDPIRELLQPRPVALGTDGYLDRKRVALDAHRSQVHPLGDMDPHLPGEFVAHFLQPREVFFPVRVSRVSQRATRAIEAA